MISIVLVNWNNWPDTIACMQSILNSTSSNYRIILVDNGSSDDSVENFVRWADSGLDLLKSESFPEALSVAGCQRDRKLLQFDLTDLSGGKFEFLNLNQMPTTVKTNIFLVKSKKNGGFGYGCNVGLCLGHQLGSSAYWLLNNDCVIQPDSLEMIREKITSRPDTIFGTVLRYYYKPGVVQAYGGGYFNKFTGSVKTEHLQIPSRPLNFINGASLIFSEQCYKEIGGFDESIFMYFEENEFCIRASLSGYTFDLAATVVFHKHGGSQGGGASVKAWKQVLLNKHYVLRKYLGVGTWLPIFYASLLLRSVLPIGEKNARIGARQALMHLTFRSK